MSTPQTTAEADDISLLEVTITRTIVVGWNISLDYTPEELREVLEDIDLEPENLQMPKEQPGTMIMLYTEKYMAMAALISLDGTTIIRPGQVLGEMVVRLSIYSPEGESWLAPDDQPCQGIPADLAQLALTLPRGLPR